MDAEITVEGVNEAFAQLLDAGDFEGAEELLARALGGAPPRFAAFYHFQYGRLYARWNKLTSAINHLHQAIDLAVQSGDQLFVIQVNEELRSVKDRQARQKP